MDKNEFLKELGHHLRDCMDSVRTNHPFKYTKGTDILPYKTGKLSRRGFRLKRTSTYTWELYISLDTVPYAQYLDDSDKVTSGFWDRAMERYIKNVAYSLETNVEEAKVGSKAKQHFDNQFKGK